MTKAIIVIILSLYSGYLLADSANKSIWELYDWSLSLKSLYYNVGVDSATSTYPLFLEPIPELKGKIGFVLPFPQINDVESKIELKVRYKSENCPMLYLRLATIGDYERITATDTLFLPLSKEWTTSSRLINVCSVKLMSITVESVGNAKDKIETSVGRKGITFKNNAKIWIDKIDIFVNGKKVTMSQFENEFTISLTKEDFVPFNIKSQCHLPFLNKKILAIGETVHGTSTMNKVAIEIIKERIKNKNCKYVLLEMPLEFSFYINRYITGDQRFKLETINAYFDALLFSKDFISFIQWLKDYNSVRKDKVSFIGIDKDYTDLLAQVNLFNFFYTINQGVNNREVDKICISLLSQTKQLPYKTSLVLFDKNNAFKSMLSEKESKLIRSCLTNKDYSCYSFFQRDSIMYQRVRYVVNNLLKEDETITMFCHFGHTNYLCEKELVDPDDWSLGHYMKNDYKCDYCNIALVTEFGNFLTTNDYCKIKEENLQNAPCNSLEYLIGKHGVESCYLSMDKFTCSDVTNIRFLGNKNKRKQFISLIPKSRMDGVIFIKQSFAIHKSVEMLNKLFDINVITMDAYEHALKKRIQLEKY